MSTGNGDAAAPVKLQLLAARPALADILERQQKVLDELHRSFKDVDDVDAWTVRVMQAAVGRVNEGMVQLLCDPRQSLFVSCLLRDDSQVGHRARARIQHALAAVFARAIEDVSRRSGELYDGQRAGVGVGQLHAGHPGGPRFR